MRLVFLGSPPFATPVLERLLGSRFRPLAVVTQPPRASGRGRKLAASPVAELARARGIECLEPETLRDTAVLASLRGLEADVLLVVSYGEILRRELLAIPRVVALNVHPSLLPRHRGATPIQAALLLGDEVTGVTIQRVALELDAGDVLVARETPVRSGETAGELGTRLMELSAELVPEALALVEAGTARYTPQDPARATFCRKLEKEHGRLDWSLPAIELERRVRAMNPWPGAFTRLPGGADLLVWRARLADPALAPLARAGPAGTVLEAGERWRVAAGQGALELVEVQAPGKRPMPAADFLRGARLAPGAKLG